MAATTDRRKKALIKAFGSPKSKAINRGARIYYGETKGGVKAALIVRQGDQIYRSQYKSVNEANQNGALGWPMDTSTLWYIREIFKGEVIVTFDATSGETWVSRTKDWDNKEKLLDTGIIKTNKAGHQIRHLSVEHMVRVDCEIDLRITRK